MQLYLYSCQDLIVQSAITTKLLAGNVYELKLDDEYINIYPATANGIIVLNKQWLSSQQHSQINFYQLSNDKYLCEIKPFVLNDNIKQYAVDGAVVKIIVNDLTYIYFNGIYYGCIKHTFNNVEFNKINNELGILQFGDNAKYIIVFNKFQIVYCGKCIDSEITSKYVQIYTHIPNMFNVGNLIKCDLNGNTTNRAVCDKGVDHNQISGEFNIVYFLEAIKCGRFKYAYSKLSYELKTNISIDILGQYFKPFDNYIYLAGDEAYITIKNNKVTGVYHFVVKNNLIENIY